MMTPARQLLLSFVLDKLQAEPVARRILLYRALAADFKEGDAEFKLLTSLADAHEELEARHQQMLLELQEQSDK